MYAGTIIAVRFDGMNSLLYVIKPLITAFAVLSAFTLRLLKPTKLTISVNPCDKMRHFIDDCHLNDSKKQTSR